MSARDARFFARTITACAVVVAALATTAVAQSPVKPGIAAATAAAALTPSQLSLDAWIVLRFKNAELLPDSGKGLTASVIRAGAPRVDGARAPDRRDTLVAVHFDTTYWRATLTSGANVRFADPSGEITTVAGRVTARRAFRAPRRAGARANIAGDWRIGWAYLVAIPARTAGAAPSGFNGWSVVETPPGAKHATH